MLMLARSPTPLAQAAILRLRPEDFLPAATMVSCIFSQTRGTPKNVVGRTSLRVTASEPCRKKIKDMFELFRAGVH